MKRPRANRRWSALRAEVLRERPTCQVCGAAPAAEVHHRKPLSEGGRRFTRRNLLAVCVACHRELHRPE